MPRGAESSASGSAWMPLRGQPPGGSTPAKNGLEADQRMPAGAVDNAFTQTKARATR